MKNEFSLKIIYYLLIQNSEITEPEPVLDRGQRGSYPWPSASV